MVRKSKSKKNQDAAALHPVLVSARESAENGGGKRATMTEEELQDRINENRKKLKQKQKTIKRMENDSSFSPTQAILGLVISLALGWWALEQLKLSDGLVTATHYSMGRTVLLVSLYSMVVITAFKMSIPHGFLCILFPPYILYFVVIPMESAALKGLVLGFAIVGYLEYRQLGQASVGALAAKQYHAITASGRALLNAGSDGYYD